jgi:hypothetical protein
MGSCCFTPRRTQFLWWYWLLLASIVGIPMFLACWYVARHETEDENTKKRLGKKAGRIFWWATIVTAAFICVASWKIHERFVSGNTSNTIEWYAAPHFDLSYLIILIIGYVSGVAFVTAIANASAKNRLIRLLLAIAVLGIYLVLVYEPPPTAELFWMLAVWAGVAHFLVGFSSRSSLKTARRAFVALICGAFLFWGVAKYGRLANYLVYQLVRGRAVDLREVDANVLKPIN